MILANAKLRNLTPKQFVAVRYPKTQIVLHHTAGQDNAAGVVDYWNSTSERVATPYIIERNGKITQCFDDEFYAYALYVGFKGNKVSPELKRNDEILNRSNIGIELTNPGGLSKSEQGFVPWFPVKTPFSQSEVFELDFREFKYWLPYTSPQLATLSNLLTTLLEKHTLIKEAFLKQDVEAIFDINIDALKGKPGIYTHVCYRTDKSDLFPHPEVINMLKTLQTKLRNLPEKSPRVEELQ